MKTYWTPLREHVIYALVDPRDGIVRHVGRTHDPRRRLSRHMDGADGAGRGDWIRELRRHKLCADMWILERIAADMERLDALGAALDWDTVRRYGGSRRECAMDTLVGAREDYWAALAMRRPLRELREYGALLELVPFRYQGRPLAPHAKRRRRYAAAHRLPPADPAPST